MTLPRRNINFKKRIAIIWIYIKDLAFDDTEKNNWAEILMGSMKSPARWLIHILNICDDREKKMWLTVTVQDLVFAFLRVHYCKFYRKMCCCVDKSIRERSPSSRLVSTHYHAMILKIYFHWHGQPFSLSTLARIYYSKSYSFLGISI